MVMRGGSHNGAVNATDSIAAGLCKMLASDYYHPAPLLAAFALRQRETTQQDEEQKIESHEVCLLESRPALPPWDS